MAKDKTFTLEVEAELGEAFLAEAAALDRPTAQILGDLVRDFVQEQRAARDYEAWFRAEVTQALSEADDPATERIDHQEVRAAWRKRRAVMSRRPPDRQ